jgi:hypothetical protein
LQSAAVASDLLRLQPRPTTDARLLTMQLTAALLCAPAALVSAIQTNDQGCDACAAEQAEYCEIWPDAALCADPCGFEWDEETRQCWEVGTKPVFASADGGAAPIIGGSGKFKYQYMPELLKAPAGAAFVNCHGLSIDADENILLTYSNDGVSAFRPCPSSHSSSSRGSSGLIE